MSSSSHPPLTPKDSSLRIPLPPSFPSSDDTPSHTSSISLSSTSSIDSLPSADYSQIFNPNKSRSFSSIPFSWEKLPGIPKRQVSKKIEDPSLNFLPLPPSTRTPTGSKKMNPSKSFRKEPFFVALVECSKDDIDNKGGGFWKRSAKISWSLSDRFRLVSMYASCKSSCPISESVTYVPKPRKHYLFNGPLINFK